MITVKRYNPSLQNDWNGLVESSANGTFLLNRNFLEYHSDRFDDHSLLLYEGHTLIGVLPANEKGETIYSHGGLTYGGLILKPQTGLLTVLSCFYSLTKYYSIHGFTHLSYKGVPSFFHTTPEYGDSYALFLLRALPSAMNSGFIVDLTVPSTISNHHVRQIKKARHYGVGVVKDRSCNEFWNHILVPHLRDRFQTKPVHTLAEITLLQKRFPKNILQYTARIKGNITGGSTIFLDRGVAHTQYIASSDLGRKTGSLDYLFWHLITHEFKHLRYFSFGTTNMGSSDGRTLSQGLVSWKEKFGASMFPMTCYDIETKNYRLLTDYK